MLCVVHFSPTCSMMIGVQQTKKRSNASILILPAAAHHSSSDGSRPFSVIKLSYNFWRRIASCVSVPSSISSLGVIRSSLKYD